MVILGVETSCDETAAAVVEATGGIKRPRFKILSNVISSQVKLHAKYGGVVPHLAAREHEKNLPTVTKLALLKLLKYYHTLEYSKKRKKDRKRKNKPPIDLITVTKGPGLEPCLWRGIEFAKILAQKTNTPIIGVNHLEGHIYSNWLQSMREIRNPKSETLNKSKIPKLKTIKPVFPAVCLIVSGGHTELLLMKNYGKYQMLGETRDDAAGEAYDKVARLLGLGFPGGPIVDRVATSYTLHPTPYTFRLPRPMLNSKNYDFSFSGLKTAVLYLIRDLKNANKKVPVKAICAEFQSAVVDVLLAKTLRAAKESRAKTIIVSGGVSANSGLRRAFANLYYSHDREYSIKFPAHELTTDNAAMIAMAGYINWALGKRGDWKTLEADANLRII